MVTYIQIQCCSNNPMVVVSSFLNNFHTKPWSINREAIHTWRKQFQLKNWGESENVNRSSKGKLKGISYDGFLFPIDPWAPNVDSSVIASQLSALSLLPYLGFLYFITKSKSAPKLTLFGFYFLLAFVGAAIPAGICAKTYYVTSLSNVDWLHGGAESLLLLTNLFIVLGLREAIRKAEGGNRNKLNDASRLEEEESSSM